MIHIVGLGSLGALVFKGFKMMNRALVAVSLLMLPIVTTCYEMCGNEI